VQREACLTRQGANRTVWEGEKSWRRQGFGQFCCRNEDLGPAIGGFRVKDYMERRRRTKDDPARYRVGQYAEGGRAVGKKNTNEYVGYQLSGNLEKQKGGRGE